MRIGDFRGFLAAAAVAIPLAALVPPRALANLAASTLTVEGEHVSSLTSGQEVHLFQMRLRTGTRALNFEAQPAIIRRVPIRCVYQELDEAGNVMTGPNAVSRTIDITEGDARQQQQSIDFCTRGPANLGLTGAVPEAFRNRPGRGKTFRVVPAAGTLYRYFRFAIAGGVPAAHQACVRQQMDELEGFLSRMEARGGAHAAHARRVRGYRFSVYTAQNGAGIPDEVFVRDPETGGNGVIVPVTTSEQVESGATPAYHFAVGVRSDGTCKIASSADLSRTFRDDGADQHARFRVIEYLRRLNRGIPADLDVTQSPTDEESSGMLAELPVTGESRVDRHGINELEDSNRFLDDLAPTGPDSLRVPADLAV